MHSKWCSLAAGTLLVATALLGCGEGGKGAADTAVAKARQAEWASLHQAKQQLDAKRGRLRELRGQLEQAADGATGATEGAGDPVEAEADRLETEIGTEGEQLATRLAEYINNLEIEVGAPLTADQQAAIRMKSDEDIVVAREYIEQGGDYRRAIDIFQATLQVDPDNPRLKEELAAAEANRWMTEERFKQAKKGMTQSEVRAALGQPNLHNIHEYPEQKTVAWLYPKGPDRSAAGVYFQRKDSGPFKVYQLDFNAVKPPPAQGGQRP
jgi:hypothetical protein